MSDSLIKNQISDLITVTDVKQKNWQVNMISSVQFSSSVVSNSDVIHLTGSESPK